MMDCVDSGNAISGMKGDVNWSSDSLKYFANLITEIKGQTHSEKSGHLNFTRRHPYGVVAKINPFNHPLRFCAEKSAAALAAGNTVVVGFGTGSFVEFDLLKSVKKSSLQELSMY